MTYSWGKPDKRLIKNGKVMCPFCLKHEAEIHKTLGVLKCKECKKKSKDYRKEHPEIFNPTRREWVPDRIKEDRVKNFKGAIQPYREGKINREFVEAYPDRVEAMIKEGAVTREEVKKSKYQLRDLKGWYKRNQTQ